MNNRKYRIAVIDDEPKITKLLKLVLEDHFPCEVEVFNDPTAALTRLQETAFDAISLDHRMPKLTGMDIVKLLRTSKGPNERTRILLLTGYRDDAECSHVELLDEAMFRTDQRQIHRMARLIEDMLDVSRISAKRLELRSERTDLCALAKDVLERFSPQFAAVGSEVTFDSCAEAIGWFDRFRMEQVIVNLFTNAMKYGGGKPVQVSVSVRDHRAVLAVRDHGIGISPADQERIFQQFERATDSEVATGLGLGLFIANQIVTAHGGTIRVKSELNAGAEFFVELPLEDAAKPRPESASP